MYDTKRQKRFAPQARRSNGDDGITFVRCRVCGERRRVISGRHLSKHGVDRDTYMKEYRLSPDELIAKEFRVIQSSHKEYRPYNKKEWIHELKTVYRKDGNVFAGYLQEKYPPLYSQGVWLFGDWDNALLKAGFDPEKMRMQGAWDEEKLIGAIRAMHKRHLPLYARYALLNHPKIFSAARRHYGSWAKALVAAGANEKPHARSIYRDRVVLLNTLDDALESHSKIDLAQPLKREAAHYFGSLDNAIAVLRKERNRLPGWNRRKIVVALSQMQRAKKSFAHALVRRNRPGLVKAAKSHFGSWGRALSAAGIDLNLYPVRRARRKTR